VPTAAGAAAAGAGVAAGRGNWEISLADPEGVNLAGSVPAELPVASLTGMPLSRSCEDAEVAGDAALAVASVPVVWDTGWTAEAWDEAAVLEVTGDELLELKLEVFCPPVAPAAGVVAGVVVVGLGCVGATVVVGAVRL
jgi:hypothetical protein